MLRGSMPSYHGHHHGGGDPQAAEIDVMLKVMAAIESDAKEPALLSLDAVERAAVCRARVSMRFELPGQL
jgi:hypothetical protein